MSEQINLAFPGGPVASGDLVEANDKAAQRVMAAKHNAYADRLEALAAERARGLPSDLSVEGLLSDEESFFSAARDNREDAA